MVCHKVIANEKGLAASMDGYVKNFSSALPPMLNKDNRFETFSKAHVVANLCYAFVFLIPY